MQMTMLPDAPDTRGHEAEPLWAPTPGRLPATIGESPLTVQGKRLRSDALKRAYKAIVKAVGSEVSGLMIKIRVNKAGDGAWGDTLGTISKDLTVVAEIFDSESLQDVCVRATDEKHRSGPNRWARTHDDAVQLLRAIVA